MKIAVIQSTQETSTGSAVYPHSEAELMGDFCLRLVSKLVSAGHNAVHFNANHNELGDKAAEAAVAWRPQMVCIMHLDSAGGSSAAMLCYQEPRSLAMGLNILAAYCGAMGYRNKGGQLRIQGVNGGRVAVIRICEQAGVYPTMLFECGDMDKPDGYNWLKPEHREKAAKCMAQAICAYAGGTIKEETEMAISVSDYGVKVDRYSSHTAGKPIYVDIMNCGGAPLSARILMTPAVGGPQIFDASRDAAIGSIAPEKHFAVDIVKACKLPPALDFDLKIESVNGQPMKVKYTE